MRCAIVLLTLLAFTPLEGVHFSAEKYIILLSSGFPKGRIGEIKIQPTNSEVVYSIRSYQTGGGINGLIEINERSGELSLLSDLETNTDVERGIDFIIEAKTKDGSGKDKVIVIIRILPAFYGDRFVSGVKNELEYQIKGRSGTEGAPGGELSSPNKFTPTSLLQFLRASTDDHTAGAPRSAGPQGPEGTSNSLPAELKIEKIIELTKEKIKKEFRTKYRNRRTQTVLHAAYFHVKELFSEEMLKELEMLLEKVHSVNCPKKTLTMRTFNGECNNLDKPRWGAKDTPYLRIRPAQYFDVDGLNDPIGYPDQPNSPKVPSPFEISKNFIKMEKASLMSSKSSNAVMQFGQFLDHDLDLTDDIGRGPSLCRQSCDSSELDSRFTAPCFPIDQLSESEHRCTVFIRSAAVFEGNIYPGTREQINVISGFIDGSQIYGSTKEKADALRQRIDDQGLLRSSSGNLLPYGPKSRESPSPCLPDNRCFLAGDSRVDEQLSLSAFHTLFLREHNRMAKILKKINTDWDGERVYQETKKIMGAVLQKIVYNDYLPVIIGPKPLPDYRGYNPSINPSISNAFATAAYRFGHSALREEFALLNEKFEPISPPSINLRFMFFNSTLIKQKGIEPILFGLVGNASAPIDRSLPSAIVDHLFERNDVPGLNLAALNIQRSRDHGLSGYNEFRKFCGLSNAKTFEDTKNEIQNPENRKILKRLYNDDPNLAELWVAGLAETALPGASMGPTLKCVIADQFRRTRDGDRFFYEKYGVFHPDQVRQIKSTSLSRIYCDNLKGIVSIQEDAFKRGQRKVCESITGINFCFWKECLVGVPQFIEKTKKCICSRNDIGRRPY